MSTLETRIDALDQRLRDTESRLRDAEDRLAILQLVATYGPAVDSLSEEVVRDLWTEDGVYDTMGKPYVGNVAVGKLVDGETHRDYVRRGCGHVMSLPHIVIDGDTAVATGHSNVFTGDGRYWRVERTSSNRWELVRTPAGWKVKNRLNRLLDGTVEHREILGRGVRKAR